MKEEEGINISRKTEEEGTLCIRGTTERGSATEDTILTAKDDAVEVGGSLECQNFSSDYRKIISGVFTKVSLCFANHSL